MARPRKTGLDYFPHDVDVTTDPKIEPAILRYGAAAYAFYFVHLEYCYRSDDLSVDISATETGEEMREVIQKKLQIDAKQYENILQSFLRHGAFDAIFYTKTGRLTSDGIKKRASKVFDKRRQSAERYENGISAAETPPETPQSKEKHSKEKKSRGNQSVSPSEKSGESLTVETVGMATGSETRELPSMTLTEQRFEELWKAYPRRVGKQAALTAFKKIKPTAELFTRILAAIGAARRTEQWQRENGRYIPNPATWLNQGRWDDEIEVVKQNAEHRGTELNDGKPVTAVSGRKKFSATAGFKSAEEEG